MAVFKDLDTETHAHVHINIAFNALWSGQLGVKFLPLFIWHDRLQATLRLSVGPPHLLKIHDLPLIPDKAAPTQKAA